MNSMELLLNFAPNKVVLQCRQVQRMFSPTEPEFCLMFDDRLNYTWINQDRKSVHLPAPTYIDYVMTWIQNLLDDDAVFPTKSGKLVCLIC